MFYNEGWFVSQLAEGAFFFCILGRFCSPVDVKPKVGASDMRFIPERPPPIQ